MSDGAVQPRSLARVARIERGFATWSRFSMRRARAVVGRVVLRTKVLANPFDRDSLISAGGSCRC